MSFAVDPPPGFGLELGPGRALIVRDDVAAAVEAAGLAAPEPWEARLGGPRQDRRPGRGRVARLEVAPDRRLWLKQLRRGGLVARVWRDRFPGTRRLFDNVRVPLEAARRGVPTPRPAALLIVAGPPGFYRGWLAVDEVPGARDLASRCLGPEPLSAAQLQCALATVRRMHDAGVEHRDLNLGNLLLAGDAEEDLVDDQGSSRCFVIDLDRARLHDGPLSLRRRRQGLERLERSWLKLDAATGGGLGSPGRAWVRHYAAGDAPLARGLERGRTGVRLRQWWHRLGW